MFFIELEKTEIHIWAPSFEWDYTVLSRYKKSQRKITTLKNPCSDIGHCMNATATTQEKAERSALRFGEVTNVLPRVRHIHQFRFCREMRKTRGFVYIRNLFYKNLALLCRVAEFTQMLCMSVSRQGTLQKEFCLWTETTAKSPLWVWLRSRTAWPSMPCKQFGKSRVIFRSDSLERLCIILSKVKWWNLPLSVCLCTEVSAYSATESATITETKWHQQKTEYQSMNYVQ